MKQTQSINIKCQILSAMAIGFVLSNFRQADSFPLVKELFASIEREGMCNKKGIPGFPDFTDEHLESLRHNIRNELKKPNMNRRI